MNLIEQVLELKAKVSEFRSPRSMGEARDQRDVCSAYTEMCCTAAPKLARALKVAMEALEQAIKNCETNGWDHEVPVDALGNIERELQ